jgi:hypothetical protein
MIREKYNIMSAQLSITGRQADSAEASVERTVVGPDRLR